MIPADELGRWEWIEDYLNGKLTEKEQKETELEAKKNPAFRSEIEEVQLSWKIARQAHTEQVFRDTLTRLRADKKPSSGHRIIRILTVLGTASVAAAVAFVFFLATAPVRMPEPDYDMRVLRARDPMLLGEKQRRTYELFFDGQARLTEGNYQAAGTLFRQVAATPGLRPYFTEAAEWHLCYALFKAGHWQESEALLQTIGHRSDPAYPINPLERWKMWVQIQRKK